VKVVIDIPEPAKGDVAGKENVLDSVTSALKALENKPPMWFLMHKIHKRKTIRVNIFSEEEVGSFLEGKPLKRNSEGGTQ
jgi:hypothetical protein